MNPDILDLDGLVILDHLTLLVVLSFILPPMGWPCHCLNVGQENRIWVKFLWSHTTFPLVVLGSSVTVVWLVWVQRWFSRCELLLMQLVHLLQRRSQRGWLLLLGHCFPGHIRAEHLRSDAASGAVAGLHSRYAGFRIILANVLNGNRNNCFSCMLCSSNVQEQ